MCIASRRRSCATCGWTRLSQSIKAYSLCAACLEASSSRVDARRSVHSDAEIAAMYEAAVEQQPDNEEFHSHIFMAHVRAQNPRAQQATALRASKRFRNDRYLFWTIMSLVWQAAVGDDNDRLKHMVKLMT